MKTKSAKGYLPWLPWPLGKEGNQANKVKPLDQKMIPWYIFPKENILLNSSTILVLMFLFVYFFVNDLLFTCEIRKYLKHQLYIELRRKTSLRCYTLKLKYNLWEYWIHIQWINVSKYPGFRWHTEIFGVYFYKLSYKGTNSGRQKW